MAKTRRSLIRPRTTAYQHQSGRCFYCGLPMWEDSAEEYASRNRVSLKQAHLFQSTGEHLKAHSDGGDASSSNIVAACRYCDTHRHKAARPLTPERYKRHVRERMEKGRWFAFDVRALRARDA